MWFWYLVDFRHSIAVFVDFCSRYTNGPHQHAQMEPSLFWFPEVVFIRFLKLTFFCLCSDMLLLLLLPFPVEINELINHDMNKYANLLDDL